MRERKSSAYLRIWGKRFYKSGERDFINKINKKRNKEKTKNENKKYKKQKEGKRKRKGPVYPPIRGKRFYKQPPLKKKKKTKGRGRELPPYLGKEIL